MDLSLSSNSRWISSLSASAFSSIFGLLDKWGDGFPLQKAKVERFLDSGEAFLYVKIAHFHFDTFLPYAVAGCVVILPDTALEKVFPLQDLATMTEPQHGLERVDG